MLNISKNQERNGFTMVEIMVVVVIVAILAAIAVPTYLDYVESARAADAKSTISAIYKNARIYYQDNGEFPTDTDDLRIGGYMTIERSTLAQWQFDIRLSATGGEIVATSTEEMTAGAGKRIVFDAERGKFTGYGTFGKDAQQ